MGAAVGATYTQSNSLPGGITRQLVVTQTANINGFAGASSGFIGTVASGGRFALSTNAGATAWASLLYTYATAQNLSVGGTAVLFTIASADLNTPFSVTLSDGTVAKTQVGVVTSSSVGTFFLPVSGFAK